MHTYVRYALMCDLSMTCPCRGNPLPPNIHCIISLTHATTNLRTCSSVHTYAQLYTRPCISILFTQGTLSSSRSQFLLCGMSSCSVSVRVYKSIYIADQGATHPCGKSHRTHVFPLPDVISKGFKQSEHLSSC